MCFHRTRVSCVFRYSRTMKDFSKWLRAAMKAGGLTQDQLAERIGLGRTAISKVLNGKRELSAQELVAIADATGHGLPSTEQRKIEDNVPIPQSVPVKGIISPGTWREAGSLMKTDYTVPVIPEPRLAHMSQYALRFEGVDPSGEFRYGDFLIFVPLIPGALNVIDGDIVHVERHDQHRKIETSIRTVHILPDGRFQLVTMIDHEDTVTVNKLVGLPDIDVLGVFEGKYSPKRRP